MKFGLWREIAGLWGDFGRGVLVGTAVPLLALAGIVAGIYLWTRKIPFLADVEEREGERRLVLKLMESAEAQAAFGHRRAEWQALRNRIRAGVESAADEVETQECLTLAQESE
jgi:hypothetical protein